MKFLPGDVYVYGHASGQGHSVVIRSEDDRWVIVPGNGGSPIFDESMERILAHTEYDPTFDREVFIRNGVDIRLEAMLGYADNIVF